jgi:dTDP-4-dehydrorhamnose reductase
MNHFWNGVTVLEWCKQVERNVFPRFEECTPLDVVQLGTRECYSKLEVLQLIQHVFQTQHSIQSTEAEKTINRCLIPDFYSKDLNGQLRDLLEFEKAEFVPGVV